MEVNTEKSSHGCDCYCNSSPLPKPKNLQRWSITLLILLSEIRMKLFCSCKASLYNLINRVFHFNEIEAAPEQQN